MASSEEFQDASTDYGPLSQRQAENVADLAARRAEERVYARIGRSVVTKAIYTVGAGAAFIAAWMSDYITFGRH